jgi:hypothetical protein
MEKNKRGGDPSKELVLYRYGNNTIVASVSTNSSKDVLLLSKGPTNEITPSGSILEVV